MSRPHKLERLKQQTRERDERREAVREELVQNALATLSELGYAQTSLRDIAAQAGRSVGLVHYYFDDKHELIIACVQLYKAGFITQMAEWVEPDLPPAVLQHTFVSGLAETIRDQAPIHRLWYDIRAEAMFDARFSDPVRTIEDAMIDVIRTVLERLELPPEQAKLAYSGLDGAFRLALSEFLASPEADSDAPLDALQVHCNHVLDSLRVQ